MWCLWLGAASAGPLYGEVEVAFRGDPPPLQQVTRTIRSDAYERRVRIWLTRDGQRVRLFPKQKGAPKLETLDRVLLDRLLFTLSDLDAKGLEQDFLVGDSAARLPTTLIWDGVSVDIVQGPAWKPEGPARDADALRADFALKGFRDGDRAWGDPAYAVVEDALGLLPDDARGALAGVGFAREPVHLVEGTPDERVAAWFDRERNEIVVYDAVFVGGFVGSPSAPVSAAVFELMHALGDAVDASARATGQAPSAQWKERFGGLAVTRRAVDRPDTAYCAAFALFHTDPAALKRVSADAHAFFEGL